jgi:hypothetical protein
MEDEMNILKSRIVLGASINSHMLTLHAQHTAGSDTFSGFKPYYSDLPKLWDTATA